MKAFLSRRLKTIPITLFVILLVNFLLINLSKEKDLSSYRSTTPFQNELKSAFDVEDSFSKSYGLELPLFLNRWPFLKEKEIYRLLEKKDPKLSSMAPYIQDKLYDLKERSLEEKKTLLQLILIGKMKKLTSKIHFGAQKLNKELESDIREIEKLLGTLNEEAILKLASKEKRSIWKNIRILFCETRFFYYLKKVVSLDFGSFRHQPSQKVAPIVLKKLLFSLHLLLIPMVLTFIFAQLLGLLLATMKNKYLASCLSLFLSLLYSIPIYIMAPLLIEKIGIKWGLPIHGMKHFQISYLLLPVLCLFYSAFSIYSRINKTLFTKILSKDYLLLAKAKGLSKKRLLFVHTLREALLTTVPHFLGSFGFFMGALIIVENLFEIEGFGNLYYKSILNFDLNVILFSSLLISLLTMSLYLLGDILLYKLDPRIHRNVDQRTFQRN